MGGCYILKWILNGAERYELDSCGSGWMSEWQICELGNEPIGFIKGREFPDKSE
jgi:hypothetical protein